MFHILIMEASICKFKTYIVQIGDIGRAATMSFITATWKCEASPVRDKQDSGKKCKIWDHLGNTKVKEGTFP